MLVSAINVQHNATYRLYSEPFHCSSQQASGYASASLLRYDKYLVDKANWTGLVFGSGVRLVDFRSQVPDHSVTLMRKWLRWSKRDPLEG